MKSLKFRYIDWETYSINIFFNALFEPKLLGFLLIFSHIQDVKAKSFTMDVANTFIATAKWIAFQ
jgi:hypothetical protein